MAYNWIIYGGHNGLVRAQAIRWLLPEPYDLSTELEELPDLDTFFTNPEWLTVRFLLMFITNMFILGNWKYSLRSAKQASSSSTNRRIRRRSRRLAVSKLAASTLK